MEKLYFKTTGQEPDVNCIEPCKYEDRPTEGTMVGSGNCQDCRACYGWDSEENWVKCLNYSKEKQGIHVPELFKGKTRDSCATCLMVTNGRRLPD